MNIRSIILHRHIFKNAGSSLDGALESFFGDGFAEFHNSNNDNGRVFPHELFEFLDQHKNIVAISSHHFHGINYRLFLDSKLQAKYRFFEFVILRHPISRLISIYSYYRTLGMSNNIIQNYACNNSLADFLEFLTNYFPNFVINPQTNMFADQFGALPHKRHLGLAFHRLLQVSALGVVERYDESMLVAEHLMQPLFGKVNLKGPRKNSSNYLQESIFDGTKESLENIVGKSLASYLFHSNALDIELWHKISIEITRRASYVPQFDRKLIKFQQQI